MTLARTARLVLRVLDEGDVEAFVAYRCHPDVHPWQSWGADYSVDDAQRFMAELAAIPPGTPGEWCQVGIDVGGQLVGDVAFCIDATDTTRASVGYTIAPEHQGHGFATEAVAALLSWLGERGVGTVVADTLPDNASSRRVLERLGFTESGATLDDGSVVYERRL